MHLSPVYNDRVKWILVYHVQPDSDKVKMIEDKFFDTEKEAWDWFHDAHRIHHWVQPEAVRVHMGSLKLSRWEMGDK